MKSVNTLPAVAALMLLGLTACIVCSTFAYPAMVSPDNEYRQVIAFGILVGLVAVICGPLALYGYFLYLRSKG